MKLSMRSFEVHVRPGGKKASVTVEFPAPGHGPAEERGLSISRIVPDVVWSN